MTVAPGNWIADCGWHAKDLLSHDGEIFWMRRNADVGEQTRNRSNDFSSEKFFVVRAESTAHVDIIEPSFHWTNKRAAAFSAGISLYKSVTNPSCKRS